MSQQKDEAGQGQRKYQRRKNDRPDEITAAALEVFAERGYAESRVSDVADRAGVSKGLMYRYFKTKEDLFRAVIRGFIEPRVKELAVAIDQWPGSAADFLRGPFLQRVTSIATSRAVIIFRLLMAEGPKHPDLTRYYHQHVISVGLAALSRLLDRAVASGEFRPNGVQQFPHLLLAPVVMSAVWRTVFDRHQALPVEKLLAVHVDTVIAAMANTSAQEADNESE